MYVRKVIYILLEKNFVENTFPPLIYELSGLLMKHPI